jgi:DNA-binding response OmpR family regulator
MARVLLVDADVSAREALAGAFRSEWLRPLLAASGEEALRSLEREVPDVLVIDAVLPGMTGLALLTQIRAQPRWRLLPILVIAARRDEMDRCVALELGADDVVDRPFSIREVVLRVRALLRRCGVLDTPTE